MDKKKIETWVSIELYEQLRVMSFELRISFAELSRKCLRSAAANYLAKMNTKSANEKVTERDTRSDGEKVTELDKSSDGISLSEPNIVLNGEQDDNPDPVKFDVTRLFDDMGI